MILIIGNGGREEALANQFTHQLHHSSKSKPRVFTFPGNGGGASRGMNLPLKPTSPTALRPPYTDLIAAVRENNIELVVVGPENYLSDGIVDALIAEKISVFGPTQEAARLESSKGFAKEVMTSAGVPTAEYREFQDPHSAADFLKEHFRNGRRWVIKADGLCAGKGVVIPLTLEEALQALGLYFEKKSFGKAGERIVIEEFLSGEEASVLAFTDGKTVKLLPASQDHKRIFEGDRGANTGGMGVYSPVPIFCPGFGKRVEEEILLPVIREMEKRGTPYRGILYAGLMIEGDDIRVIEFNVRFGDPECQCVLPLLESDLTEVMQACIEGKLHQIDFRVRHEKAVCVVLASGGYPGEYETGKEIVGMEDIPVEEDGVGFEIFQAGTEYLNGKFYTAGGRVLSVCGYARKSGVTLKEVIDSVYRQVKKISFEGCYYRKDIGKKALYPLAGIEKI